MSEYTHIQELNRGAGTQGTLLIPRKIYDTLIPEYEKMLLGRDVCGLVLGPEQVPGRSADINLESVNAMNVRIIAEGAEIVRQEPLYTSLNVEPLKYGARVDITREMMEDSQFPLLQRAVELIGKRFAENETSLMITQLNDGANTVAGGAAVTVANLTRAMQYLEADDATPTHWIVGVEVANDLRNIDSFFEAEKSGGNNAVQNNFMGTIYGLPILRVSSNAGMTSTTAYCIDKRYALVCVEKRPITAEAYTLEIQDIQGVALTQRIAFDNLRTTAIAIITSS